MPAALLLPLIACLEMACAADRTRSHIFKSVAIIKTQGNLGFSEFRLSQSAEPQLVGGGSKHYLAAANSWDLVSRDHSGSVELFEVSIRSGGPLADGVNMDGSLRVKSVQTLPAKGAAGIDFFSVGASTHLLVLTNRLDCGDVDAAAAAPSCNSTHIYSRPMQLPRGTQASWVKWTSLPGHAAGPTGVVHFDIAGEPHIVIGALRKTDHLIATANVIPALLFN